MPLLCDKSAGFAEVADGWQCWASDSRPEAGNHAEPRRLRLAREGRERIGHWAGAWPACRPEWRRPALLSSSHGKPPRITAARWVRARSGCGRSKKRNRHGARATVPKGQGLAYGSVAGFGRQGTLGGAAGAEGFAEAGDVAQVGEALAVAGQPAGEYAQVTCSLRCQAPLMMAGVISPMRLPAVR